MPENTINKPLTTFLDLYSAVQSDNSVPSKSLKEIAILFLKAMEGWPVSHDEPIQDFVNKLYAYYGFPLTNELIEAKKFDPAKKNDSWHQESGYAIAQAFVVYFRNDLGIDFSSMAIDVIGYVKMVKMVNDDILKYSKNKV